jgi:hypothetical protein
MMSSRIPSVNDTFFQHKVLTKVHGQPTYESLQTISTELKANAASVPSTLGGGLYGHLGLVLSLERYATLANSVPWVTPVNPPPFVPPAGATAAQLEAAREVWRERRLAFDICQATEKALIALLVEAIDPIYLRALLNRTTGQYSSDIRAVLLHLFATHGKVTPQQIKTKELNVYNMSFDISQPVDTVFNVIEDLSDLAENGGSTMTASQMMNLAFVIFSKQPILQHDLRLWNRRPLLEKTWDNMLTHFRDAQSDLGALPNAGDMFHQANSANAVADLVAQRLLDAFTPVPETDPTPAVFPPSAGTPAAANSIMDHRETSVAAREAALLAQMQDMMSLLRNPAGGSNNHNNRRNNSNNNRNRSNTRTNDRSTPNNGGSNNNGNNGNARNRATATPRLYCWSHGACAHGSSVCNTQLPGHQTGATFANMQGGSTQNCFWLPA